MSQNFKILIVEDEPVIAADLTAEIMEMGYEVVGSFESGEEAIAFVEANDVDMVLMDIQLAGDIDGVDTAHNILKLKDLPIVFLTSNTDQKSFARAKLTTPHAFLSKPFRKNDLKYSLMLALESKEVEDVDQEEEEDEIWFDDRIFIRTKEWLVKIKVEDLLWVKADSCYCTLNTKDKNYTIVSTLKRFNERIVNREFMRVHRSYIVNLDAIDKLSDNHLAIGNQVIPIGKTYKQQVQKKFRKL